MSFHSKNKHKGLTLIEIILTIVWVSICIIPMIYTYSELISLQTKLFHKYQALTLTQKNIEIATNIAQSKWNLIESQPVETSLMVQQDPDTKYWTITPGIFTESIYNSYFIFKPVCKNSEFKYVSCDDPEVFAKDPNSVEIISKTTWKIRGLNQELQLSTNLTKTL